MHFHDSQPSSIWTPTPAHRPHAMRMLRTGGQIMAHPITLNPGTPSEITAEPGAISIPDVWHIALELKATGARVTLLEDGELVEKLAGDYILDCWHLAHALRRYIIDHQEAQA